MSDLIQELAHKLIHDQKTLVLATAEPDPWAAPVYYLYRDGWFHFFSSPRSRHIGDSLASERCAAAIFRDGDDWQEIEGLQMSGRVVEGAMGGDAEAVLRDYIDRFPTVRSLLESSPVELRSFCDRFRSELYAFVPSEVYYLNNRMGFGTRQEIKLSD